MRWKIEDGEGCTRGRKGGNVIVVNVMILLMKSDKTTWGYCGCLRTRHCRKDPTLCSKTESFQISTLSLKTCGIVCWAPCPNKNAQSEEERGETERWRMERLSREYKDIDGVGLYNFYRLSSLRVDDVSRYFSHHKITFKVKKAGKVAMIKAHIGRLLYNSMERQPASRNVQQQVTFYHFLRLKLTRKMMW